MVAMVMAMIVMMVVAMAMVVPVFRFMLVRMAADFYVANAEPAAAFFAHIIVRVPPRRYPAPARAAARR